MPADDEEFPRSVWPGLVKLRSTVEPDVEAGVIRPEVLRAIEGQRSGAEFSDMT